MLRVYTLLFFCVSVSFSFAQTDTITLVSDYQEGEGLRLKWFPATADIFFEGFKKGYNIYRAEAVKTPSGGEKLGAYTKVNTQEIKYWSYDEFEKEYAKDTSIIVAEIFVSGADEIVNRKVQSTPGEAADQQRQDDMLYFIGLVAAVGDNKVAEAIGLYYVDETAVKGKKYIYKIELIGESAFTSYHFVNGLKEKPSPKIMGLVPKLFPKAVHLSWYNNKQKDYPYYNIYRSTKKNNGYTKLNDIPYTGSVENNITPNYTFYVDSIPEYDKTYYYKIYGVNFFAEEGGFSEPVEVKAMYLLESSPQIVSTTEMPGTSDIELEWRVEAEDESYIKGYSVFRAAKGSGPYLKVNDKMISNKNLTYFDKSSKSSANYYVVTAYGASGDSVNSIMKAHLLLDSIPPAQPVFVSGKCDTNGIVSLVWEMNTEPDLVGYRIFSTYDTTRDALRVIPGDTLVSEFTDTVDLKRQQHVIYYRIFALDNHYNPSLPSVYFAVKLPDMIAPLSGFLETYSVGVNGVTLKWVNSASTDLAKMHLMRKSGVAFEYKTIFTTSGDSLSIGTYTDTTTKSGQTYSYVVMAEDEAGLKSVQSKVFKIRQFHKEKKKPITNLGGVVNADNKLIKLTWEYASNAKGFTIYRAKGNEPLATYKHVAGKAREFYDKNIKPNTTYTYLMIGELKGGYSSGYSERIEVKY